MERGKGAVIWPPYFIMELRLRTKEERLAFMDGYEQCFNFVKKYLPLECKQKVEVIIITVRDVISNEDIKSQESEDV